MAQAHLTNGMTIEFESYGEGDPILLVMGLGAQLLAWPDDFVEVLVDRGHQVIRFDNRDVGLSTKCEGPGIGTGDIVKGMVLRREIDAPYSLSDMAEDAIGLLNTLGIESAHVVGTSMGGMIAQTLAIEYPDRIKSLTSIMSNPGDGRSGLMAPRIIGKVSKLREVNVDTALDRGVDMFELISGPHFDRELCRIEIARGLARNFCPEGGDRQLAAIAASPDRTEALGQLSQPVLVIHGLADELVKPSGGIATANAAPGSRLLMFPDMGHDLPRARWPEIIQAILDNVTRARHQQNLPSPSIGSLGVPASGHVDSSNGSVAASASTTGALGGASGGNAWTNPAFSSGQLGAANGGVGGAAAHLGSTGAP